MCSELALRACALLVLTVGWVGGAAAQDGTLGGHPIEFGAYVGAMDFDDEIRFENDVVLGLTTRLGFAPWFQMGIDLSQMTMRDRGREDWTRAVTFALSATVEPWTVGPISPGASMGVSFMAFEESPGSDAISEGLDLGLGLRWLISPRWNLRGDIVSRMQTFKLVPVGPTGEPFGDRQETGYLWSRVFRLGLTHVF